MNESTDSTTTSGVRSRASNLKRRLQQDGKDKLESGKRAAADQIAEIADAIDMAGAQLDQSQPTLANYASRLADGVAGIATRLREDSIEDLYRDIRQVATRHPGMFLLGSAALGLVISRFMKATAEEEAYAAETEAYATEDLGVSAETEAQQWGESAMPPESTESQPFYDHSAGVESPGTTQRGV
ncbi:hypothetical protein JM946_20780 [Steroidobacter sp. S1-65]|uniref:DUF3618 domain-containing protein n=1 Tax=Steroidobacter gossypii TaxID=2805490 RepID=A0ABS1X1U8_9GAMM|nr:hypothetical protein [Steroidobacter gossypii]MBM0107178.1 hypothetical protein [Steroidobacter gossypii]